MSSRGLAFRLAGVSSLVLALALTGAARAQDAALTPAPELHDFVAPLPPDVEARFEDVTRQPQTIADIQTLMPSLPSMCFSEASQWLAVLFRRAQVLSRSQSWIRFQNPHRLRFGPLVD